MKEQLLKIAEQLNGLHILLALLQARDAKRFPLPGNADEMMDEASENLNRARADLIALAKSCDEKPDGSHMKA